MGYEYSEPPINKNGKFYLGWKQITVNNEVFSGYCPYYFEDQTVEEYDIEIDTKPKITYIDYQIFNMDQRNWDVFNIQNTQFTWYPNGGDVTLESGRFIHVLINKESNSRYKIDLLFCSQQNVQYTKQTPFYYYKNSINNIYSVNDCNLILRKEDHGRVVDFQELGSDNTAEHLFIYTSVMDFNENYLQF